MLILTMSLLMMILIKHLHDLESVIIANRLGFKTASQTPSKAD